MHVCVLSSKCVQCMYQCPLPCSAGRITHRHYKEALVGFASGRGHHRTQTSGQVLCFICGPPPLIEAATASLTALGVLEEDIHFEQWW